MPEGIQVRGQNQYRVQVRHNGVYQSRTFKTLRDAREWQRVADGKVSDGERVDAREARATSLAQACAWMLEGSHACTNPNAKNVKAKLRYWKATSLASWSITAIHDWDLIEWRRQVLDEDNAEDGEVVGPDAECGLQSVIHRLNALSKLVQTWGRAHSALDNPVKRGVRPHRLAVGCRPRSSSRSRPVFVRENWRR